MAETNTTEISPPSWMEGDSINEIRFATWFIVEHDLCYSNGHLFNRDGILTDEQASRLILENICLYVKRNVTRQISGLLSVIKLACDIGDIKADTDRIHFQNGTYYLDGYFTNERQTTLIRLPVAYDPAAQAPAVWLKFLSELLEPDDILTLQEFMGYCLLPVTYAQKMLLIIGKGGEGKSRIGRALRAVFGDYMNITSIQKLATNRFCPADQEGKLLMLDDDMKMEALPDTNVIKSIVTMEDKMDLERKNKQSVQGYLFVRLMGFGNGSLSSLHDRSEGFYRRQIVLHAKDKPEGRIDDPKLGDKIAAEAPGIALWMLEGLHRLIGNNYRFTEGQTSKELMRSCRMSGNNILEFYESEGYIRFEKDLCATTKDLYAMYRQWCYDNAEKPFAEKTFAVQLSADAKRLGIVQDKNISIGFGKKARGYRNICIVRSYQACA